MTLRSFRILIHSCLLLSSALATARVWAADMETVKIASRGGTTMPQSILWSDWSTTRSASSASLGR